MKNKKLWLSLLVVALIVCLTSVGLFACSKSTEDTPTPTPSPTTVEQQALDAIISGIQQSIADGDMDDLKVDANLGLKINDDQYNVKLALELDLLQKSDPSDKKTSNTWLNAELTKGSDVILGLYYWDAINTSELNSNIYEGNTLYVQYKPTDATSTKKIAFPAPYIAALQNELNGRVNFSNVDLSDLDFSAADVILGIIAGLAEDGELTSTKASVTLKIGSLLNDGDIASLIGGIQGYFDSLDLDITASELGQILPNITLTVSADLKNGKVTGVDLKLGIDKKDVTINHKSNGAELLVIKMDDDVTVELSLDFALGKATEFYPSDISSYVEQENIVDAKISVDLFVREAISISFDLNGNALALSVQPGYYTLSAEIAANPWTIVPLLSDMLSDDSTAFSSTNNIIESITELLQAINALELDLTRTKDGAGAEVTEESALYLVLTNNYVEEDGKLIVNRNSEGDAEKLISCSAAGACTHADA